MSTFTSLTKRRFYDGKRKVFGLKLWLGVTAVGVLALLFGACAPIDKPATVPTQPSSPESGLVQDPVAQEPGGPLLSDALKRDCGSSRTGGGFDNVGLAEGDIAVDFTLKDIDGNTVNLADLLSEKPVVMVFGSFT